jgi:hypothetical protein
LQPPSPEDVIDYRMSGGAAEELAEAHIGGSEHQFAIHAPVEGFRHWNRDSGREDGGSPGGFDEVAATYLVREGLPVPELQRVFRESVEAATWIVRFFTPMQKEEIFVEIDPRDGRVTGYHKYQDEQRPGLELPQPQALALARRAFAVYGVDVSRFDLIEALTFAQPNRRDWLFHFQERKPIAGEAYRRVAVRVAGAEVTQFNETVHIPESVRREASEQTLLNVILFAFKVAGIVALLSITIAGLVVATRSGQLPWKRALKWTAALAIIPIAAYAAKWETLLFGYGTSTAWDAFRIALATDFLRDLGMRVAVAFLGIAGLTAVVPYALDLWKREGRRRLGRSAVVAALTAVAILVVVDVASGWAAHQWPEVATVSFSVAPDPGMILPGPIRAGEALWAAIVVSAAVALYRAAVAKYAGPITIAAISFAMIEPQADGAALPLMLTGAIVAALVVWVIARYVLHHNLLAWPMAVFLAVILDSATTILRNSRPDMLANGFFLIAVAAAVTVWTAWE